jgi:hypothetical protein
MAIQVIGATRRLTMKIPFIFAILTLILTSACASYEGKQTTKTRNSTTSGQQYSFIEKAAGKEFSRQ